MKKREWIRLAAAFLALILYAGGVFAAVDARQGGRLVHISLGQGVDAAGAKEIFAQEGEAEEAVGFCLWGERPQQWVSCQETGGMAQVTQLVLGGNPELMGAGALNWQLGCLIDGTTARALFGTEACGGQVLQHQGKAYPVLGTVEADRPTLVTLARPGEVLNRGVLALPLDRGRVLGEQCLVRWGLSGTVLDLYPLLALMENLLLLLPGVLLLAAGTCLGRGWRGLTLAGVRSESQRPLLGRTLLALAVILGTLWALGSRLVIPADMIPSRWSDFSFWGTWWASQRENFTAILAEPLENGLLQMLRDVIKSMGYSTAAALLLLWAVRRKDHADIAG